MDSCPACRAFLQPDWDRCKICGHVLGAEVDSAQEEAGRGRKRRRKAGRGDPSGRPPAVPAPRGEARPSVAAAPPASTATAARPTSSPRAAGLPPLFADEVDPPPARGRRSGPSRTPWFVIGLVVVVAVVAAVVLLGGDDGDDPWADRPAAESAEPAEDQPAWTRFPVGPASVELPAPPFVEERVDQILVIGAVSLTTAEAIADGLTYSVAVGELPEGVRQREPDELLERMVDRWVTAEAGRVVSTDQVTVGGAPALRAEIAGLERDVHVVAIIDGGLLAELRVAGQEPDPAAVQRLIDSFDP